MEVWDLRAASDALTECVITHFQDPFQNIILFESLLFFMCTFGAPARFPAGRVT